MVAERMLNKLKIKSSKIGFCKKLCSEAVI